MPAPATDTQWYLARNGEQFGPLSDAELAKFIELGHLQPTDLLWREGFPDWRPAMVVFPQPPPAAARPAPRPMRTAPSPAEAPARQSARFAPERGATHPSREQNLSTHPIRVESRSDVDPAAASAPRNRKRVLLAVLLVAVLAAAAWLALSNRTRIADAVTSVTSGGAFDIADRKSLETPPFSGFSGSEQNIDGKMQATALWRVIKREFPDWYDARVKDTVALAAQNRSDGEIGQYLARSLVGLRRQQVGNALSAGLPRLKKLAEVFYGNLVQLKKHSTEACYGFISQGEASPIVLKLMQGSDHTAHLQAQITAVFEAIAEGRKTPRVYPPPRKTDYEVLAADLTQKMGWTQADLQLFSDERALARANPEKVCQLLHDWFAAQLAIKDGDVQLRLLVDSLRPVVAG